MNFSVLNMGFVFLAVIIILLTLVTILIVVIYNMKRYKNSFLEIEKECLFDKTTGFPNERYIIKNFEPKSRTYYLLQPRQIEQLSRIYGPEALDAILNMISLNLKKVSVDYGLFLYKYKELGVLLVSETTNEDEIISRNVNGIISLLVQEFEASNKHFNINFWISVYSCKERESIFDVSLKLESGLALHKKNNKRGYVYFKVSDRAYDEYMEVVKLERELFNLDFEECINPYYQLKYDITTNKIVGCEALARINHPTRGIMNPDSFIPFYEEIDQVHRVDIAIFRKVCEDIASLSEKKLLPSKFRVSVNFSTYTIENINTSLEFANTIEKTGLDYNILELELTETLEATDICLISERLNELSKLGVIISLDDFFAGNSNFEKISVLPVNNLKLDKAFLEEKITGKNADLIKSIKTFCESNNLSLIVEGVETEEHIEFLKSVGINLVQGFYYSKPLTMESLEEVLTTEN